MSIAVGGNTERVNVEPAVDSISLDNHCRCVEGSINYANYLARVYDCMKVVAIE